MQHFFPGQVVSQLSHVAEAVQELSVEALLNFTKLVSVILKVSAWRKLLGLFFDQQN